MDIHSMEKAMYGDVENDEELMAELLALEAEERAANRISVGIKNDGAQMSSASSNVRKTATEPSVSKTGIAYGAASISDTSDNEDDKDIDDPDLLDELSELIKDEGQSIDAFESSPQKMMKPSLSPEPSSKIDNAMLCRLKELGNSYSAALAIAKKENNVAKQRRYQRGADKIAELMKFVQCGRQIIESEIPVALTIEKSETAIYTQPSSQTVGYSIKDDTPTVSSAHVQETQAVDANGILKGDQLITVLSNRRESYVNNARLANQAGDKKIAYEYYTVAKQFDEALKAVKSGGVVECDEKELPPTAAAYRPSKDTEVPPTPKTILEGLEQRLEKYKNFCEQSKLENNERKLRMNSRLVKQYEEAIRACKLGHSINVDELPCPPGFPALPAPTDPKITENRARPLPQIGPLAAPEKSSNMASRQQQQLHFLLSRQLQFKKAALVAKNKGNMAEAKKLLLSAKGFDKMIEASKAGLPVNIEKTPIPPQVQMSASKLLPTLGPQNSFDAEGTAVDVYAVLEKDLIKQIKLCEDNRLMFTRLGDVSRVKTFETWSSICKRDLMLLRELAKRNAPVPRFRYENRNIPSADVCIDVDENHMELTIVRVTDARLPSGWQPTDGYIFVKYNFSFPHDAHQTGKTKIIERTNSPEYKEKFSLTINRKQKQLMRIIKRNCLKFEVYQKGGFLRSDRLLGTIDCKLIELQERAQIHAIVDLMEGRKKAGGLIEYKIRVREPLGEKKLSLSQQKWLLLES